MKKLLVLILALAMVFCFSACQSAGDESESAQEENNDVAEESTAEEIEEEAEAPADSDPSDEDVARLFAEAREVYEWYDGFRYEVDNNDSYQDPSTGYLYYRLISPSVSSVKEMENRVRQYFSSEIADGLLSYNMYIDHNGAVYRIGADRGADITRGDIISMSVTDRSDSRIVYTVVVESLDFDSGQPNGSEKIEYILEKIGDQWLFTQFEALY